MDRMFIKNLKYLSLFLSLSSVLCSCIRAMEEENFSGFSRGFLTPKSKTIQKKKSTAKEIVLQNQNRQIILQPTHDPYSSALALFEKQLCSQDFSESSVTESLWGHPLFLSSEARQQIYNVMGGVDTGWIEAEKNFSNLATLEKDGLKLVCESREFFRDVLKLWGFFNNVYSYGRHTLAIPQKPELLPFIMQNLVHWVIQAKFDYMDSLPFEGQNEFKKQFITPESDLEKGEFILFGTGWDTPRDLPKVRIRYFQQTLKNNNKVYRICDQSFTNNKWVPINKDGNFQYYGKGEITYSNSGFLSRSGFILDNYLQLLENEGFIFTKEAGNKPYRFSAYEKHSILDEMFFFYKAEFDKECVPPLLRNLLDSVGGVEQLEAKEFIFIPKLVNDEDTAVLPSTAKLLLPYLYELKEAAQQNLLTYENTQIGWLDETIQELKTILVEEMCSKENKALDQEIANVIAKEEVEKGLESANPELLKRIEEAKKSIHEHENTKAQQRKKLRDKAKKQVIQQVKREKAQAIDPELVRQRRKERELEKIEQEYTRRASLQRNFSTSEAQELLGEMVEEISTLGILGIEKTGEVHSRGSHMGIEISGKDSESSTSLGLARRPQKRGYQSGTVKHIIKDMIQRVTVIVSKK